MREWKVVGDGVEVTTEKGTYRAAKLIVTAGAWATRLLADIGVPLAVMRQTLLWFDVGDRAAEFRRDKFPIFIADVPGGPFYGLPAIDRFGVKVARHYGAPELPNPDGVNWNVTDEDVAAMRPLIDTYLPGLGAAHEGAGVHVHGHAGPALRDRHSPAFPAGDASRAASRGTGSSSRRWSARCWRIWRRRGATKHEIDLFSARRFQAIT